jgi:hypothetical protein
MAREMQNSERSVFSFQHGVVGMLVATVLLLSILAGLSIIALTVQQNEATNVYKINDINNLQMNSSDNNKNYQLVK